VPSNAYTSNIGSRFHRRIANFVEDNDPGLKIPVKEIFQQKS
jgi:hypothetical protein